MANDNKSDEIQISNAHSQIITGTRRRKFLNVLYDEGAWYCSTCKMLKNCNAKCWVCECCNYALCELCMETKIIWNHELRKFQCYNCSVGYEEKNTTEYIQEYIPPEQ